MNEDSLKVWCSIVLYIILYGILIYFGAVNLDNCPVEKNIPIFLISAGVLGILVMVPIAIFYLKENYRAVTIISIIVGIPLLIYLFVGAFWVYKECIPSHNKKDDQKYCDLSTYWVCFGFITISILEILYYSCAFMVKTFLKRTENEESEQRV